MDISSTVTLRDGNAMPLFGLGVFRMENGDECERAVRTALDFGYRHIDTAVGYRNEEAVGKAIRESGVLREEIYVTTKVPHTVVEPERVRQTVADSLQRLDFDYIDLCLMHWPLSEGTEAAFETLVELREAGKLRSAGVSNYSKRRFEVQFFERTDLVPAVNQVERHPTCAQSELLAYCRDKGIQLEAYSPLARAVNMTEPTLEAIGHDHGKTVAQVMLRWQLQQNVVVIPKSSNPERIRTNAEVFDFELSDEEMARIGGLNREESIIEWRPEPNWF